MHKNKFTKHKKISSRHYLTVNISGINGDSLADGALGCTTCFKTTSTVASLSMGLKVVVGVGGRQVGCDGPSQAVQVIPTP
jgi:hypothetical protein